MMKKYKQLSYSIFLFFLFLFLFLPGLVHAKAYTKSEDCKECHEQIYKEWKNTPHARAWIDPVFKRATNKYKKEKCLPCHSPEPVLETGIVKDRILRSEHRKDGVDCLTCHKNKSKQMGTHAQADGECNPGFSEKIKNGEICFACHKTETEEWKNSSFFKKGITCVSCHMEKVIGEVTKNKKGEYGEHRWSGGRSPLFLESAVKDINLDQKGDALTVTFTPFNVGHNFPTGTSGNPSLHIVVVIKNSSGDVVKLYRKNFIKRHDKKNADAHNAYEGKNQGIRPIDLDESEDDTSVRPDEKIEIIYKLPVKKGLLDFIVFYKAYAHLKDRQSIVLKNILYEFNED